GAAWTHLQLIASMFPRTDTLLAAAFGANTAMLGVAFARAPGGDSATALSVVLLLGYAGCACMSYLFIYRGVFPDVEAQGRSLIYFGQIAELGSREFEQQYRSLTPDEYEAALLQQVWRNSMILSRKFAHLRSALS